MGFDRIRSRVEVVTREGRHLVRWANDRYRGGPDNPLSDIELEGKFRDAAAGLLDEERCRQVAEFVWKLDGQPEATAVLDLLDWGAPRSVDD
jgi:2-methylcitrate dehydratase PrpD